MFCSLVARLPPHTTLSNFGERDSPALVSTDRGIRKEQIDRLIFHQRRHRLPSFLCADKWQRQVAVRSTTRDLRLLSLDLEFMSQTGRHFIRSLIHHCSTTSRNFFSILVFDCYPKKWGVSNISQCYWSGPSQPYLCSDRAESKLTSSFLVPLRLAWSRRSIPFHFSHQSTLLTTSY